MGHPSAASEYRSLAEITGTSRDKIANFVMPVTARINHFGNNNYQEG